MEVKLSECEEMIMSVLLETGEDLTLTEIMDRAKQRFNKDWKIRTIATFLARMELKGYIRSHKIGRYTHYWPNITLQEFREQKFEEMIGLLLFKDAAGMGAFLRSM